ncbi:MAG: hypothetical protein AVDCRST_MAG54-4494, partial [uncultured Actinomycetospora sp.]
GRTDPVHPPPSTPIRVAAPAPRRADGPHGVLDGHRVAGPGRVVPAVPRRAGGRVPRLPRGLQRGDPDRGDRAGVRELPGVCGLPVDPTGRRAPRARRRRRGERGRRVAVDGRVGDPAARRARPHRPGRGDHRQPVGREPAAVGAAHDGHGGAGGGDHPVRALLAHRQLDPI